MSTIKQRGANSGFDSGVGVPGPNSSNNIIEVSGKNNSRISGQPQIQLISADQIHSANASEALTKQSLGVNLIASEAGKTLNSGPASVAPVVAVAAQSSSSSAAAAAAERRPMISALALRPPPPPISPAYHAEASALATLASALDPVPSLRKGNFSQVDSRGAGSAWNSAAGSYLPNDFHRNDYHTSDTFPGPTKIHQARRKSDRRSKEEKKEAFRKAFPPQIVDGPTSFPMLSLYRVFGKYSMEELKELTEDTIRQLYQNWRDVEAHNRKALRAQKKFSGRPAKLERAGPNGNRAAGSDDAAAETGEYDDMMTNDEHSAPDEAKIDYGQQQGRPNVVEFTSGGSGGGSGSTAETGKKRGRPTAEKGQDQADGSSGGGLYATAQLSKSGRQQGRVGRPLKNRARGGGASVGALQQPLSESPLDFEDNEAIQALSRGVSGGSEHGLYDDPYRNKYSLDDDARPSFMSGLASRGITGEDILLRGTTNELRGLQSVTSISAPFDSSSYQGAHGGIGLPSDGSMTTRGLSSYPSLDLEQAFPQSQFSTSPRPSAATAAAGPASALPPKLVQGFAPTGSAPTPNSAATSAPILTLLPAPVFAPAPLERSNSNSNSATDRTAKLDALLRGSLLRLASNSTDSTGSGSVSSSSTASSIGKQPSVAAVKTEVEKK